MANNVFPPRPPFPPAPPRGRSVPPPPPGVMQYIGARYVPIFADPIEWQQNKIYEPLTIVTYNNSSYTSKQTVPAGISPDNGEYWVETGNFNAQLNDLSTKIDGWDEEIAANTQTANEAKATADAAQKAIDDLDLTGLQQSVADAIQKVDDLEPLVHDNADDIATNTAAISQNTTDIQKNAADIANLQSADTALGNRVTACENNISTAQADIAQAQTDIGQNTTNISANTTAISGLTSDLTDANTAIQKNETDIAALRTDVNKNTSDITAANTNITNMQTQVDNVAGQIQTIKDQSDAATAEVERLTDIVGDDNSGLIKDFNDLKEAVESGESVEALAGRVGLLENQVGKPATETAAATGLEKKVADNTAAITANTTAIGDNAASLTDLENQVGHAAEGENPATGLVKEIDDLKASIGTVTGDVGDRLDTLDSEVAGLKATVGDATSGLVKDVDANMGDIAALQADVATIQGQQTAQDTAISGNTTAIGNAVNRITSLETGKQDKLSVDATLNFTPNDNPTNLGVKIPSIPITQAEYDALTEKEDKLYVITDSSESGGGGGGTAGVSSFNGRSGAVVPAVGDYTAAMVGAIPISGGNLTGMLSGGLVNEGTEYFYRTTNATKFVISKPTASTDGVDLRFAPASAAAQTATRTVTIDGVKTPVNSYEGANKLYVDQSRNNYNHADNAYFLNPVNQRGKNKYDGAVYTIDRWKNSAGANSSAELTENGIKFTSTAASNMFRQDVDNPSQFAGRTITVSILGYGELSNTLSVYIRAEKSDGTNVNARGNALSNFIGVSTATLAIPSDVTEIYFGGVGSIAGGSSILIAAKMEIGNVQTLAHQESSTWVVNDIPNYGMELLKCQRYYYQSSNLNSGTTNGVEIATSVNTDWLAAGCHFPIAMRDVPTVTISDVVPWDNVTATPLTVNSTNCDKNGISTIRCATGSLTSNRIYYFRYIASADL